MPTKFAGLRINNQKGIMNKLLTAEGPGTGPGPIDPKNPKEPPPGTTPPKKD